MALNPADFIDDLIATEPLFDDPGSQADDHMRAIKKAIRQTFPTGWTAPLVTTILELQAIEARLVALEAFVPPDLVPPKFGIETIAAPGDIIVTGLGFQPALVMAVTLPPTIAFASLSIGAASDAIHDTGQCLTMASDAEHFDGMITGGLVGNLWQVFGYLSSSPELIANGSLKTYDADGFTMTSFTTTLSVDLLWIAFR